MAWFLEKGACLNRVIAWRTTMLQAHAPMYPCSAHRTHCCFQHVHIPYSTWRVTHCAR
jgi:hypothetical protein